MQILGNSSTDASGQRKIVVGPSTISLAVMVTVFLIAVIFAANQNDVIGWLVVIISLGWLLLSLFLVLGLRRGAKKVNETIQRTTADMAPRAQTAPSQTTVYSEADRTRDLKLDHSFKIVQVQSGVIKQYLDGGTPEAREMVDRAIETIEITASNARDMMKGSKSSKNSQGGSEPLSGDIIS
ncbi:hypothetical protein ACXA45_03030 [Neomicrococcus lactis]|uniref:hypothetical protein n=1 Tax=Neomicrococcus lactis TaxID=732241 RepID=UPI0023012958|nr:hypothetical protein [Neomicrococcus lactis]